MGWAKKAQEQYNWNKRKKSYTRERKSQNRAKTSCSSPFL